MDYPEIVCCSEPSHPMGIGEVAFILYYCNLVLFVRL